MRSEERKAATQFSVFMFCVSLVSAAAAAADAAFMVHIICHLFIIILFQTADAEEKEGEEEGKLSTS